MAQDTQSEKNLYQQLKAIGIDEELAHQVDKSLSPERVATKEDVLVMQEAILQAQVKSEDRYQELRTDMLRSNMELRADITRLDGKVDRVSADLRVEIAAMSRQFWITFFGLALQGKPTILSVFAVNWYFH